MPLLESEKQSDYDKYTIEQKIQWWESSRRFHERQLIKAENKITKLKRRQNSKK